MQCTIKMESIYEKDILFNVRSDSCWDDMCMLCRILHWKISKLWQVANLIVQIAMLLYVIKNAVKMGKSTFMSGILNAIVLFVKEIS